MKANSKLLDAPGETTVKEPKGGTSTYVDPKVEKVRQRAAAKAERERKQRERAAEKERKEALKKEVDEVKASYSEQLAIAMAAYSKGDISYSDYIKTRQRSSTMTSWESYMGRTPTNTRSCSMTAPRLTRITKTSSMTSNVRTWSATICSVKNLSGNNITIRRMPWPIRTSGS